MPVNLQDFAHCRDGSAAGPITLAGGSSVPTDAAAVSDVDAAERDPHTATLVNAKAPGWLAQGLGDDDLMVHLSTDYVFGGATVNAQVAATPYDEEAPDARPRGRAAGHSGPAPLTRGSTTAPTADRPAGTTWRARSRPTSEPTPLSYARSVRRRRHHAQPPRPTYLVLGLRRWSEAGLPELRSWRSALHEMIVRDP